MVSVASQSYKTGVEEEYVILGNDALMRCKVPSFVSDFVSVAAWLDNLGNTYFPNKHGKKHCYFPRVIVLRNFLQELPKLVKIIFNSLLYTAVSQSYITETNNAHVILGNSALLKCEIPSFVADFVTVDGWADNEGSEFFKTTNNFGNL